jgi:hypothetical protein
MKNPFLRHKKDDNLFNVHVVPLTPNKSLFAKILSVLEFCELFFGQ